MASSFASDRTAKLLQSFYATAGVATVVSLVRFRLKGYANSIGKTQIDNSGRYAVAGACLPVGRFFFTRHLTVLIRDDEKEIPNCPLQSGKMKQMNTYILQEEYKIPPLPDCCVDS
jgi:hypothetical protein